MATPGGSGLASRLSTRSRHVSLGHASLPWVLAGIGLGALACGEKTSLPEQPSEAGPPPPTCLPFLDCSKQPPYCESDYETATGPAATFAVSKVYLGDTDRNGVASPYAWREFGYDIDLTYSTAYSWYHCAPRAGADAARVKTDGVDGIDNSFGANVVPALLQVAPDLVDRINAMIAAGELTMVVHVGHTGNDGECLYSPASILFAGEYVSVNEAQPAWDGSDSWPVLCEMLETCLPSGTPDLPDNPARMPFPRSRMGDFGWVSGDPGVDNLGLTVLGQSVLLQLHETVVTTSLPRLGAPARDGLVSAVVRVEELVSLLFSLRDRIAPALCDDGAFATLVEQIRGSADIMHYGMQEFEADCTGISIGLGFESVVAEVGVVLDKRPIGEPPCERDPMTKD